MLTKIEIMKSNWVKNNTDMQIALPKLELLQGFCYITSKQNQLNFYVKTFFNNNKKNKTI